MTTETLTGVCSFVSDDTFLKVTPKEQCLDSSGKNVYDDVKGCPFRDCQYNATKKECENSDTDSFAFQGTWTWMTNAEATHCPVYSPGVCMLYSSTLYDKAIPKNLCVDPTGTSMWDDKAGECKLYSCYQDYPAPFDRSMYAKAICDQFGDQFSAKWIPWDQVQKGKQNKNCEIHSASDARKCCVD